MKSFYISVILFVTLLALIVTNSTHLIASAKDLANTVETFSMDNKESFNNSYNVAYDKWQKLKNNAKFSCCHSEISTIDLLFEQLKVYVEEENHHDFETAKRTLMFNLNELTRLEKTFD